jgi:hypothetical protein
MRYRWLHVTVAVILSALGQGLLGSAQDPADQESTRSWPPDTTPYVRPAVPEDTPRTRVTVLGGFMVDTVVNNTDTTLTNTDMVTDSEPGIAVNPSNPNEIVITAGFGGWGGNAPLWHSTDGGQTWTKRFTIPAPPGVAGAGCPCDQTMDYGRGNRVSGTFLATDVYSGTTTDPANAASWNWLAPGGVTQRTNNNVPSSIGNVDQPWLLVNRDPTTAAQDNVYVAYDNFNGAPDMRVAVALGTNPPNFIRDGLSGFSSAGVNPGHRLAVDPRNGFVYSLFQQCAANCGGDPKNINYVLNQSTDGGQTWSLNGSAVGVLVANADSTQPTPKFGTVNALLGGVLHAAVDPNNGDVYYVYGKRDSVTGNNRLAIRRIVTGPGTAVYGGPEAFVTGQVQAAVPSVAVDSNGTVGVFYYTFDGFSGGFPSFTAHLAWSQDQGQTFTDLKLLTFLSAAVDSCPAANCQRQRVLGDYVQMKAVGNQFFYGTFTANGVPFGRPFANHDAIFFKVSIARAAATLVSPTGITPTTMPTYTWNAVPGADSYLLWVNDSTGHKFDQWIAPDTAGCASGTGACSYTPGTALAGGAGTWWIRTWSASNGYGPWSAPLYFTVSPRAATLVSPSGNIITNSPTYTWNAVGEAASYYLWVNDSTMAGKFTQWIGPGTAGCGSGTGTCSFTPGTALAGGGATWWIQTWSPSLGYGPWSAPLSFTIAPPAATLVSPSGPIGTKMPTYTWNVVAQADSYYLWVNDSAMAGKVTQWIGPATAGCGGGTGMCSFTPPTNLATGAATWWIQTWSTTLGYGPWSAPLNFTVP